MITKLRFEAHNFWKLQDAFRNSSDCGVQKDFKEVVLQMTHTITDNNDRSVQAVWLLAPVVFPALSSPKISILSSLSRCLTFLRIVRRPIAANERRFYWLNETNR